jgi:hypothetical protein
MSVPCVYDGEAASYRLALCRHASGPALVLIEGEDAPSGYEQIVYLARLRLESAADTCASVSVEVVRRVCTGQIPDGPVIAVAAAPVLPDAGNAERVAGRAKRARIRELRQQLRTLKEAGTSVAAMTAAQRAMVTELTALLVEGVPIFVP